MLGDITKYCVDAIVNAANEDLMHIGGIAKAIADAGNLFVIFLEYSSIDYSAAFICAVITWLISERPFPPYPVLNLILCSVLHLQFSRSTYN